MANILELQHVTKVYPGVVALDDVSLSLEPGEIHSIMGENGAGKSALIKIVAGILLIALLGNGMQMSGMNIYYQYVAKGVIMLATIGFDTFQMSRKKLAENTRKETPEAQKA